jgi:hypothetical protein
MDGASVMAKKMKMHAEEEKINQRLCDTILENRERDLIS